MAWLSRAFAQLMLWLDWIALAFWTAIMYVVNAIYTIFAGVFLTLYRGLALLIESLPSEWPYTDYLIYQIDYAWDITAPVIAHADYVVDINTLALCILIISVVETMLLAVRLYLFILRLIPFA